MATLRLADLLHILKRDRIRLAGILIVILCVSVFCYDSVTDKKSNAHEGTNVEKSEKYNNSADNKYYASEKQKITLQTFDPNTADSTVLLSLGLQPWQVRAIYRYRAKGGTFTCPEDFANLYGLTVKKYRELKPYIRIGEEYRAAREVYGRDHSYQHYNRRDGERNEYERSKDTQKGDSVITKRVAHQDADGKTMYITKLKPGQTVNINDADTLALQRVPGIGPYFARRIFRYREKLGGYVSVDQMMEIEDFPESTLPYLSMDRTNIRKININTASTEKLRSHPYISYLMARQIADYRRLHGRISNLSDLRLLPTFKQEIINKLQPYIEY